VCEICRHCRLVERGFKVREEKGRTTTSSSVHYGARSSSAYRDDPERHNPAAGFKGFRITKKDLPAVDPFTIEEAES
jgi:hypothetical protein